MIDLETLKAELARRKQLLEEHEGGCLYEDGMGCTCGRDTYRKWLAEEDGLIVEIERLRKQLSCARDVLRNLHDSVSKVVLNDEHPNYWDGLEEQNLRMRKALKLAYELYTCAAQANINRSEEILTLMAEAAKDDGPNSQPPSGLT